MWRIFGKPKILARDVFETSQRRHEKDIFFERYVRDVLKTSYKRRLLKMILRRLKDVTKKIYFLRCIWDVLKTSQKRHLLRCFWEVFEIFLSMEIWLRSLGDISCRLGLIKNMSNVLAEFLNTNKFVTNGIYIQMTKK